MKTHMGSFMGTVEEVKSLSTFLFFIFMLSLNFQAMANVEGPDEEEEPLDEISAAVEEEIAEEEEAIVAEEEVCTDEFIVEWINLQCNEQNYVKLTPNCKKRIVKTTDVNKTNVTQAAAQLAAVNESASEAERASGMEESEAESTASGSGKKRRRRKRY